MKPRLLIIALCCFFAIGSYLLFLKNTKPVESSDQPARDNGIELSYPDKESPSTNNETEPRENVLENGGSPKNDSRLAKQDDGTVHFLPAAGAAKAIKTDEPALSGIRALESVLGHYRFAFKVNPIGENFEITRQLTGKNPKKVVFITSDSAALKEGQIVDNFGTPYFFHSISSNDMEIRSAGEDRIMWTDDDVSSHD